MNGTCEPATSSLIHHRHCICFSSTADDAIPEETIPAIAAVTDGAQPPSGETDAGKKDG